METPGSFPAHHNFVRNARAAIYVWLTLSVLLTVLVFTVLLVPHWLGHVAGAFVAGHMGLYQRCLSSSSGAGSSCSGSISNFSSIGSGPLQGATLLVIFAAVLCVLSLASSPLLCVLSKGRVFLGAGIMQLVVAVLLFLALIIFPAGWDDDRVRQLCGPSAGKFFLGGCRLRWAFPLAILTFLDAAAVSALALVLAGKLIQMAPKENYAPKTQYGRGSRVAPLALEASVYARKVVDLRTVILPRKKNRHLSDPAHADDDLRLAPNDFVRMRNRIENFSPE